MARAVSAAAALGVTLCALVAHPGTTSAQTGTGAGVGGFLGAWSQRTPAISPPARSGAVSVFDPAMGRVVVFGGEDASGVAGDTWTWDGDTWAQAATANPPARSGAAAAFDAANGTVVLFGGQGSSASLGDTWTWNGGGWILQAPPASPPARSGAVMAFDPATGTVVLFGGRNAAGPLGDTWTWDGTSWTQRTPGASPTARWDASGAFDPQAGAVTLFGGHDASGPLNDTWSWNGSTWVALQPSLSPPARSGGSMAFAGGLGTLVLFGGESASGPLGDTWAWNGTTWSPQALAAAPAPRTGGSLAGDDVTGQLVLFGGSGSDAALLADTWTYGTPASSLSWSAASPTTSPPAAAMTPAFDPAAGRLVVYAGGIDGTIWFWDGSNWANGAQIPSGNQAPSAGASLAFDDATGSLVLVGQPPSGGPSNVTWVWTSAAGWAAPPVTSSPSIRNFAAMVYDPAMGKVVLFGGSTPAGGPLGDTWTWDGTTWTQLAPPSSPPARDGAAMAFDPDSGELVLFGGLGANGYLGDTWTWDGSTWAQRAPATSPPARAFAGFDDDPAVQGDLLFGGLVNAMGPQNDTWVWRAGTWARLSASAGPAARYEPAAAFDPATGQFVVFGGGTYSGPLNDTWTFAPGAFSTATSLSSSVASAVVGQPVTLTAAVSVGGSGVPTGGAVQFLIDGTAQGTPVPLDSAGGATATTRFSTPTAGGAPHAVSASYTGAGQFAGSSASLPGGLAVTKDGTTTTIAQPGPGLAGQPVSLDATVVPASPGAGTPTGTVAFNDGSSALGSQGVGGDGHAVLTVPTMPAGTHQLTATYSGDASFDPSTGNATLNVHPASGSAGFPLQGGPGGLLGVLIGPRLGANAGPLVSGPGATRASPAPSSSPVPGEGATQPATNGPPPVATSSVPWWGVGLGSGLAVLGALAAGWLFMRKRARAQAPHPALPVAPNVRSR